MRLGDTRRLLGVAQHDRALELGVVALGVDHAVLEALGRQLLEDARDLVDLPPPETPATSRLPPIGSSSTGAPSSSVPIGTRCRAEPRDASARS